MIMLQFSNYAGAITASTTESLKINILEIFVGEFDNMY
jgi:hypothetical protein